MFKKGKTLITTEERFINGKKYVLNPVKNLKINFLPGISRNIMELRKPER